MDPPAVAAAAATVAENASAAASLEATPAATAADVPASPATVPKADQIAAAVPEISAEHTANLLSVDEKHSLEQQQAAAETARKEAEERYQKAEEQRRNAKVC